MGIAIGAAVLGAGAMAYGTSEKASAANKARKEMKDIANTPGIDFTMLARDAMSGYNANYGGAYDLASRLSKDQQAILSAQEEQALPGIGVARGEALGKIRGLFADDSTWLKGLQRRGAALGIGRGGTGYGGSVAGQIGELKLSDTENMQRTQMGTSLLGSLIGGMRLANTPGITQFLGPSMSEQLNQRSLERTQKMQYQSARAGMPTGGQIWGDFAQQIGGTLMGAGMMGMGGGGGGFGGGGGMQYGSPMTDMSYGVKDINPNSYGTARGMLGLS